MEIFFSVVIPTYNPSKYLRNILDDITNNECLDKIEVILSDDCSTENLEEIIEPYNNLNIRIIKNDKHYGFPRTGRQNGLKEAKGKWICFIDQDDDLIENTFDKLYDFIIENKAKNYITSDFNEKYLNDDTILRSGQKGWTHGKLYEKSFIKKYNIYYDDLQYCEDINFTSKVKALIFAKGIKMKEYPEPFYIWNRRGDSLATIEYFKDSMPDYIRSTTAIAIQYIEEYKDNKDLFDYFVIDFICSLYHVFFYFQSGYLCNEKQRMIQCAETIQPYLTRFHEVTNFSNKDIINFTHTEFLTLYNKLRNEDFSQITFIEQMTFMDWLDLYFD